MSEDKKMILPSDKLSRFSFGELEGRDNRELYQFCCPVNVGKKDGAEVNTMLMLGYDDQAEVSESKMLTSFDRAVHDAIVTLYVDAGKRYITNNMIQRVLRGKSSADSGGISKKSWKAIDDSITKMMYSQVRIDATKENEAFALAGGSVIYDSPILPAGRVVHIDINGNEVAACIHVFKKPPLFEYAESKRQIRRIPLRLLDTPLSKSDKNIVIQMFLLRRVMEIQSGMNPVIRWDSLYGRLKLTAASPGNLRKQKADIRSKAKQVLDYWVREGLIEGYERMRKDQVDYGIRIVLANKERDREDSSTDKKTPA